MNGFFVCEDSHRSRYADTVIGSEGRTISGNPFPVVLYISLDGIFLEIEDFITVLLRYHIHVSLQDHARTILHSRRSGFTDEHIADLVLQGLQAETLTIIH